MRHGRFAGREEAWYVAEKGQHTRILRAAHSLGAGGGPLADLAGAASPPSPSPHAARGLARSRSPAGESEFYSEIASGVAHQGAHVHLRLRKRALRVRRRRRRV
jgi:hypothetical protein